jgi:rhodanese-related sulfurtransferase
VIENVPPRRVWEALRSDPKTQLVDGRTDPEWNFVSLPDLASAGKQVVLIPWQVCPSMQQNAAFTDQLKEAGFTRGIALEPPLTIGSALARRGGEGFYRLV